MSTAAVTAYPPLPYDQERGTWGMSLFILTEAILFVMLFFAYYYLGSAEPRWPPASPPKLHYALPMLAILVISSLILFVGEERTKKRQFGAGRLTVGITLALGGVFLALSYFDYSEHLRELPWRTNAYSSIFYTITSFHLAHLILGMCMLAYAAALPLGRTEKPPHRPLHTAALYWHFVDLVWVFVVVLLYVWPHFT